MDTKATKRTVLSLVTELHIRYLLCLTKCTPKKEIYGQAVPRIGGQGTRLLFQRQTRQNSQRTDRPLHQIHYNFPLPIQKKKEKILTKHWNILQQDSHLKTILPPVPRVTYWKAPNLNNKIAPSKLKSIQTSPSPMTLLPLYPFIYLGLYQCRKALCKTRSFVHHGEKSFCSKEKPYPLDHFYNCSSDFVVYGLTCPCGLIYVGRTICPLR